MAAPRAELQRPALPAANSRHRPTPRGRNATSNHETAFPSSYQNARNLSNQEPDALRSKFSAEFDQTVQDAKLRRQRAAFRSPNTVACGERCTQSLPPECRDHGCPA